jgi:4a-hydroxytetrahydrobiopterin dehydratase
MSLSQKTCTPCQGGIPPLTLREAQALLPQAPGWRLLENGARLERRFHFTTFAAALAFVNRVGDLAEQEGHHPDITFGWGYASVLFYTHKIGGLHENDFIMAAKVNELYAE